jgi:glycosyltransferase involved in cell wall biosynthesis
MKTSILLYTESPNPSGMGEQMLTLAEGLQAHYRFLFACPPTPAGFPLLARAEQLALETLRLDRLDELTHWLWERRIDLVHNHAGIGWEGHAGVYASRETGLPVIRTEHLPYLITDPGQQADHARMLEAVDVLVCVSEGARRTFEEAGVDPALLCVVRNGVPDVAVPPDRAGVRQELGLAERCPLVLTVGRFTPQKNYPTLLDAVPAVLKEHPKAQFVWVGEGPLWDRLYRAVQARGLAGHVHLVGQRSDVPRLMAAADLFVLPSQFEGLPLVILEAMASGLPVVGTRVCGIEEAVEDGVTGRLVPLGNIGALSAAIREGLADAERRMQWSWHARTAFDSRWRADRMARDMQAVYEELLNSVLRTHPRTRHIPIRVSQRQHSSKDVQQRATT